MTGPSEGATPSSHGSTGGEGRVWRLVDADRPSLLKLVAATRRQRAFHRVLRWGERAYLRALFMVEWDRLRSPVVLKVLAPMVEKMLKALGRYFKGCLHLEGADLVDRVAVKGAFSLMGRATTRMMRGVAHGLSAIAQAWGHRHADQWPYDAGFLRYLAVMNLPQNNNPYTPYTIRL